MWSREKLRKLGNKFEMETSKAIRQGYEMCPCCGGLAGEMRLREGQIESLEAKYGFRGGVQII